MRLRARLASTAVKMLLMSNSGSIGGSSRAARRSFDEGIAATCDCSGEAMPDCALSLAICMRSGSSIRSAVMRPGLRQALSVLCFVILLVVLRHFPLALSAFRDRRRRPGMFIDGQGLIKWAIYS